MKDYSMKDGKKNYILRIEEDKENGTFSAVFADGSKLADIEANEENIAKVIRIQEKQAKEGLNNKAEFVRKKTNAGIMTGFSAAATLGASIAVSNIPVIEQMLVGQNPVVVAAGIGVVTILGAIPACVKLLGETGKVTELEKLEYFEKNKGKLANYRSYHNVLRGLKGSTFKHFNESSNPYCILDIDKYDQSDLEIIMENIRKEEEFGFTYRKNKSTAKK